MATRVLRTGGYTPSEEHLTMVASTYAPSMGGRAIIYAHGAGGNNAIDGAAVRTDLELYADRGYVVSAPLMGGALNWGNPTSTTAIDNLLVYLNTTWGADVSKVMFIADSMGAVPVLNWAVRNPTRFGAAVLRVPAVSMKRLHGANTASLRAGINAAYTDLAGFEAAVHERDPLHPTFLETFRASGVGKRIRIYYNARDTVIAAADVLAFSAATGVPAFEMNGDSHAPWGLTDPRAVLRFLRGPR